MRYLTILIILYTSTCFTQGPIVYSLNWYDLSNGGKSVYFFSVSDQYAISNHPDSAALPAHLFEDKNTVQDYYSLRGVYRQRCLDALNIGENDVVYLYDYASDKLLRFYIRSLKLIAVLSPYASASDYQLSQYDYMIGFEIDPAYLKNSSNYHSNTLVAIGKTNPFTRGQMQPVVWKTVDTSHFPTDTLESPTKRYMLGIGGETYAYHMRDLTIYVQNKVLDGRLQGFHVKAIETQTQKLMFDHFYQDTEGSSIAYLNGVNSHNNDVDMQFTGQLFKGLPPVLFGFLYQSFGCPAIEFLEPTIEPIYINCDNRH